MPFDVKCTCKCPIISNCLQLWDTYSRPIKETREKFQYTEFCYSAVIKEYTDKINTEGYYVFPYAYQAHRGGKNDTSQTQAENTCVFFKDGSFIYNFSLEILHSGVDPKSETYSRNKHWGTWTVSNDTIKSQFIEPPGGMSWSRGQIWFKIIDKNTLELLAMLPDITAERMIHPTYKNPLIGANGRFVAFGPLPDPQKSWLMERKWFWCDQQEYHAWKLQKSKKDN